MLVSVLFSCLSVELFATGNIFDGTDSATQELSGVTQKQINGMTINCASLSYTVNPLYDGVVSGAAPSLYVENEDSFDYVNEFLNASFGSIEEAAAGVRNNLKNRTAVITANVYSPSSDYQSIIDEIIAAAMRHTGVGTEGDYLLWHYLGYGGNVSYVPTSSGYQYSFRLEFTYYTTKAQEDELTVAVNALKKELDLDDATDYEKVQSVYDYICENIEYDHENLEDDSYTIKHTAYSALMHKKTVCQGYATLFYRLMLELGVDCRVIAGTGGGGPHGWNIVELDGLYYNLDATWDAPNATAGWPYEYFLKCDSKFTGHYPYDEYKTTEFTNAYPKGTRDYLDSLKPEFEIVDGVLISYNGDGGDVVIPDQVTAIGDSAFEYCSSLNSVKLPEGLKTIGTLAFCGCSNLKSITIPAGVTYVDMFAFDESGLTSITFLSFTTEIYQNAFTIPSSATIYGYATSTAEAYAKKYSRTFVTLTAPDLGSGTCGNGVEWVLDFFGNLIISGQGKITSVPWNSLADKVKTVTVGEGITSITANAFSGCTNAKSITFENKQTVIPDSASAIPSGAVINGGTDSTAQKYAKKYNREYVDIDKKDIASGTCGDNLIWRLTEDGVLIISGSGTMSNSHGWRDYKDQIKSVIIESGVTSICGYAFQYCKNLVSVSLPDTLTAISSYAFSDCTALTSITIPGSVKNIPYYAFISCSGLTEIILKEGIEVIEYLAFSECSKIESVVIPESLKELGDMAFLRANSMEKITFLNPDTVIKDSSSTIPSSAVIYGYDGSTAQAYAKKYSRKFVDLEGRAGDLDDDGEVTRNDAVHLLYHSLFPENYPVSQDCDYNGDGAITRDDAIYLLYHSLFPDAYPIQ